MAQPNFIYDGDLSQVTQDGPGWFTRPFQDRGDTRSWEWHANYTQLASSYQGFTNSQNFAPGPIPYIEQMYEIATVKGVGYLVHEDEPSEVGGTGLLRFKRTYAGLPYTRYERASFPYAFQLLATGSGTNEVQEWNMKLNGFNKFEYFLSTFPPIIPAPNVQVIFGLVYKKGGYPVDNTPGSPYVAEDSDIEIYKGSILQRKTTYYLAPNFNTPLP